MAIPIRKGKELDGMRVSCGIARDILLKCAEAVEPGITTGHVDAFAAELMREADCRSAFLGYRGFPGHICISINEEVVHGIGGPRVMQFGDIVKIDVGIVKDGWVGDNAVTVPVGQISEEFQKLLFVTEESLAVGMSYARDGVMLGDLGSSIERCVVEYGFTVVREYVGHGVGRKLHEEPQVPNYGKPGERPRLREGMILAIEPMVNSGVAKTKTLGDGWTVVTADKQPSAHFEHTVLVTKDGPEILTPRPRLTQPEVFQPF